MPKCERIESLVGCDHCPHRDIRLSEYRFIIKTKVEFIYLMKVFFKSISESDRMFSELRNEFNTIMAFSHCSTIPGQFEILVGLKGGVSPIYIERGESSARINVSNNSISGKDFEERFPFDFSLTGRISVGPVFNRELPVVTTISIISCEEELKMIVKKIKEDPILKEKETSGWKKNAIELKNC